MSLKADLNRLPMPTCSTASAPWALRLRRKLLARFRELSRALLDIVPGIAVTTGAGTVDGEPAEEKVDALDRLSGGVGGAPDTAR